MSDRARLRTAASAEPYCAQSIPEISIESETVGARNAKEGAGDGAEVHAQKDMLGGGLTIPIDGVTVVIVGRGDGKLVGAPVGAIDGLVQNSHVASQYPAYVHVGQS